MISFRVIDGTGIQVAAEKSIILTERLMWRIGNGIRMTTIKLTGAGVDYRGKPFAAYSTRRIYVPLRHKPKPKGGRKHHLRNKNRPLRSVAYDGGYYQYRSAHGRSTKPDLQFTGKMLGNFGIVALSANFVRLGFPSRQEAAKALGNITGQRGRSGRAINPRRFIGIGPEHEKGIRAELEARLEEVIGRPAPHLVRKIG